MCRLSIIVPTLNEEENLPRLFESFSPLLPLDPEIIMVDGGSTDGTREAALHGGGRLIRSSRGRGRQLRSGASDASGRLLLFLHADSVLTPGAIDEIDRSLDDPDFRISLFRLRFDADHIIYRLYAFFARFDSVWTTFGDQGLLIDREFYHHLGGFPETTLFEDVEFFRRARRAGRIRKFRGEIITSTRRFQRVGPIRLQMRNLLLLSRYLSGSNPELLAGKYQE